MPVRSLVRIKNRSDSVFYIIFVISVYSCAYCSIYEREKVMMGKIGLTG